MEGDSKNLRRQIEPKWPRQHWHPSLLRKAKRNMTITPSAKKFVTTPGSTKNSSTTSKASPTSATDRLTMQGIINASLCKSTFKKYLSYQTRLKEYCAEKNIIYDSSTVNDF